MNSQPFPSVSVGNYGLLDCLQSGVVVVDSMGCVVFWNQWVALRCGTPVAEAQGMLLTEVLAPIEGQRFVPALTTALKQRCSSYLSPVLNRGALPLYDSERVQTERLEVAVSISPLLLNDEWGCIIEISDATGEMRRAQTLRSAEARRHALFEQGVDALLVLTATGRVEEANLAAETLFNTTRDRLVGQPIETLVNADETHLGTVSDWLKSESDASPLGIIEITVQRPDGSHCPVDVGLSVIQDKQRERVLLSLRDLSARKRLDEALHAAQERAQKIIDTNYDGVWDWDPRKDHLFMSAHMLEMIGLPDTEEALNSADLMARTHCDDQRLIEEGLQRHFADGTPFDLELRFRVDDENYRWFIMRGRADGAGDGEPTRMVGVFRDIHERKKMALELQEYARIDGLTGLFNRRYFYERLGPEFARSVRSDGPLSVVQFDLDHFKAVNDTFGHGVGDEVLRVTGELVRNAIRLSDFAGRLGGEEFCVVLTDTPVASAVIVAERIRESLRSYEFTAEGGRVFQVTASFGLCEQSSSHTEMDALIRDADHALYAAKNAGRDRIEQASAAE